MVENLRRLVAVVAALIVPAGHVAIGEEPTRLAAGRPLDCQHIRLSLGVDLEARHVEATARLDLMALRRLRTITLDAKELQIDAVTVARDGGPPGAADFAADGRTLEIRLAEPMARGDKATVVVDYQLDDPTSGLHFFGPSEDEPDVPWVVWSQGESTYSSYWFPCFDHPNERQTTELIVTADDRFKVSSNGTLLQRADNGDGTATWHWLQDRPHVAYLVSMVVGEFHVERETWRGRPVEYWVHPPYAGWIDGSFRNTTRMLDFFSESIGVEYPWSRYAQICCEGFGGGMENTSATTLGNRALHDERSLLDSDSDGLLAHELAHQWWGDLLTCRDWAHIWLNEGFASYFEALWDEYDRGPDEFAYNMWRKANRAIRGGRDRPIVDRAYRRSRAMFDSRAYPKGAWVLHMMRRRLGDERFWAVMNAYATEHAYRTVETSDLRKTVESVTGRSFERFFHDWTGRPGHPEVRVAYEWLNEDGLAKLTISQTQEAYAFHFPLTVEFRFDGDAEPVRVTRDLTGKSETAYQPLPAAPRLVRVDPDQAVLMELEQRKGDDLWRAQLLEDPSPVLRIRAVAHFADSRRDADHRLLAEALQAEPFWGVRAQIAEALGEVRGDAARDALVAGLHFDDHKARRACAEALRAYTDDALVAEAIRPFVVDGDPSYDVEAAAIETYARLDPDDGLTVLQDVLRRESRMEIIRRAALSALGRLSDPGAVDLLLEWSQPDKPRLARPAALEALGEVTGEQRLDEQTVQRIVRTLTDALDDTGRRVRMAAVQALRSLDDPTAAREALDRLREIAETEPNYRLRSMAERAVESISSGQPPDRQLADLREELQSLEEANKALTERLQKLEAQRDDPEG